MNQNKNNWSTELEQYKTGKLTAEQRFQLEKAALDDRFLFDALEGYTFYANAGAKSDNQQKPGAAQGGAKVFSMRNIAVAASLALLVGVVAYMQTAVDSQSSSAGETASVIEPQSTPADRAIAMNNTEPELEKNISQNSTAKEVISEKAAQEEQDEEVQDPVRIAKKKIESTPTPVTRDKSTAAVSTQKPRANTQEKIVAGANAAEAGGTEIVSLSKKKFAAKEKAAKTTDDLTENTLALSDKKLSKKKSNLRLSENAAPVKNEIALESFTPTNKFENIVTPPGGWSAFNKYIATSKKSIQTLKPQPIRVSFTIAADGTLENIMTNKTTCSACQEEAIRLIKNSGQWKSKTGKAEQINYLIKF